MRLTWSINFADRCAIRAILNLLYQETFSTLMLLLILSFALLLSIVIRRDDAIVILWLFWLKFDLDDIQTILHLCRPSLYWIHCLSERSRSCIVLFLFEDYFR